MKPAALSPLLVFFATGLALGENAGIAHTGKTPLEDAAVGRMES